MVKKDLLTRCKGIPVLQSLLLSLLVLFSTGYSYGQTMACNDQVNVSLNEDCEARITPLMILEGESINLALNSTVKVSGIPTSVPYSHPVVTTPGFYSVTVTSPQGNSCWGNMLVEDKLPPVVNCNCPVGNDDPACSFLCTDEVAFLAGTLNFPKPTAVDACTATTVVFGDQVIQGDCGFKTIRRTWIFSDAFGNTSAPCVSEYYFEKVDIFTDLTPPYQAVQLTCGADVSMPGIFTFIKNQLKPIYLAEFLAPPFNYNQSQANAAAEAKAIEEANKHAWPTVNGIPLSAPICNIMAAKQDTEIPACGPTCTNSKKVIRLWTIIDWCTGETRTVTQIIKATDDEAPTIVAKNITVSVDPWVCAGNFLLPAPDILHDNCDANPTYTVEGPFGVVIKYDIPSKRFLVTGAPKGVHTFTYVGKDCCENEGRYDITVTIVDRTPPVAVAKQYIVISLTTDGDGEGIAKLFANSVDNGSYDQCSNVHLEIRREFQPGRDEIGCGYTGNYTYNADGHPNDGSSNPNASNYDPDNGAYVKFCCADITNTDGAVPFGIVKVWMRVWDDGDMNGIYGTAGDNFNETWVEVRVEDKLPPKIVCPPDITLACNDDHLDLSRTGRATAYSNCLNLETEFTDVNFLNSCGNGYVLRNWRVKGKPGFVCTQRITKYNPFPLFAGSIVWPSDRTTNCAGNPIIDQPTWTAGPCDQVGVSLKSDTFYFEGNACLKILNRWTVIDWCQYDPNATAPTGYYTHTQTIKVIDEVKPTLGSCADLMFEINDDNDADNDGNKCERKNLVLTQTATDQGQCASDWLKWVIFVDLWGDGTNDYEFSSFLPASDVTFNDTNGNGIPDRYVGATGQGQTVSITIPEDILGSMSNHKVRWSVSDGCGNVTSCSQNFMVVDKKKPTPYCLNISSALMLNGQVELWAVDFNLGSFDNCTAKNNLLYTFDGANPNLTRLNQVHYFKGAGQNASEAEYNAGLAQKWLPASNSSGRIFNCSHLPSVDVQMTVWDEKLNFEYCLVKLNLADNQGACGNTPNVTVTGTTTTQTGAVLIGAEVTLANGIAEMTRTYYTGNNGIFAFPNTVMHYDYTIQGAKNDDYLNGVSTLDLVLIQRHILDLEKLNNPYNIIAADVNNDQKVTAADMVELRKLILGIYNTLPSNGSWKFINAKQTFFDVNHPWPLTETINLENLSSNMENQNFISVKVGDVNGSASSQISGGNTENRSVINLKSDDQAVASGQEYTVSFTSSEVQNIYGFQFTMDLKNAELIDVFAGSKRLADANIARQDANRYTVSWNDITPLNGNDVISFRILSKANGLISDMVDVNSTVTKAEIYTGQTPKASKLSLRFADKGTDTEFVVYQNEPNPFKDNTSIGFNLPEAGKVKLTVTDINGREIYTNSNSFGKGYNNFTLNRNDIKYTGVMIYKIESGSYTATKKMIGLE
ncbi:MAG: T9SS type A sorting domain-containing protein [Saprospiraceae bacterium]|nr:T9SS type A sorting domain-containing protein [Saprospiraceae bacterium]